MPRFTDKTIEEIKSKINIKDVVSPYVRLVQKGSMLWAKCPFHGGGNERTESFKIDIDRGTYYCFGCHASGSMFNFIMEMEHMTFPEAVEYLAEKAGVQLEVDNNPYEKKKRNDKQILNELYDRLTKTFRYMLLEHPQGQKARDYLEKRNVTREWIDRFQLGYAPADPRFLYNFLAKHGYSAEILGESGLFSKKNTRWPMFCDRLMFPVRNVRGQVIAYSGRDLSGREDSPKYINSPDTLIYNKKANLFGIYESLDELKKKDSSIILCEGNFDVIAMHQAGLTWSVASLGTSFTEEQAALIERYTKKVHLLFDSDAAGQQSTDRVIDILQKRGFDIRVHRLTQFKDASETLEKIGSNGLKNDFESSLNAYDYLVQKLMSRYNIKMPREKSALLREISPFLMSTPSEVERDSYIQDLAFRLGVSEDVVRKDLEKSGDDERGYRNSVRDTAEIKNVRPDLREASIHPDLRLMLILANKRDLFKQYRSRIKFGDLKDRDAQVLYSVLENSLREEVGSDELFLSRISDDNLRNYVSTSFALPEYREAEVSVIEEIIEMMSLRSLKEQRARISDQIDLASSDPEVLTELLEEKMYLDNEIRILSNKVYNGEEV